MTRRVHGALLKNERLKLYKKPSTWVLMGIIVGIILLVMLLTDVALSSVSESSYMKTAWKDDYTSQLQKYTVQLNNYPNQPDIKSKVDSLTYLLDHDIPPYDWRTDAVTEYNNLKNGIASQSGTESGENSFGGSDTDETAKIPSVTGPAADSAQTQQRIEQLQTVIEQNDWRSYIEQRIDALESGAIVSASEAEKEVDIEMCRLYLDNDITPVSASGSAYALSGLSGAGGDTWKSTQVQTIRNNKLYLRRGENAQGTVLTNAQQQDCRQAIAVALKRLSTGTEPVEENSFLGLWGSSSSSLGLLTIMIAVLAGGSIASEYGTGTIKLLLITPHKRQKIFWAKAVLLLEVSFLSALAVFVLSFLLSGALKGFGGLGAMQVVSLFGEVVNIPYFVYILFRYLLMMLPVLAYGALALMLSAVTRKGAASIAVTLVLLYGGDIFISILKSYSSRFVVPGIKFLLFANTSLEDYLPSASASVGAGTLDGTMTLGFSVAVLLIYMGCFLWIARDSFCRRDVK